MKISLFHWIEIFHIIFISFFFKRITLMYFNFNFKIKIKNNSKLIYTYQLLLGMSYDKYSIIIMIKNVKLCFNFQFSCFKFYY